MENLYGSILREILEEGKQVGVLYHFTSYNKMIHIAESDLTLKAEELHNQRWVSFTRNKRFNSSSVATDQVRISLDGDALSNKYKTEPHSDITNSFGRGSGTDESEERIDASKYGKAIDIKPYVTSIDVIKYKGSDDRIEQFYEELIHILNNRKISYNIVDKLA